jgi:excisionase family DNA binding protein
MSASLLTTRAVAEHFNVSTETVLRWHRAGELPAVRLASNALRFQKTDLEAFLKEREEGSGTTA